MIRKRNSGCVLLRMPWASLDFFLSSEVIPSLHAALGLVAQSCQTLVTPWTVARQAPLSVGIF